MPTSKPLSDKKVHDLVQKIFLRPYARRMKYIYTGMLTTKDIYVLGNRDEESYKFAEHNQAMGLVKITDAETLKYIEDWFAASIIPFFTKAGVLDIVQLSTLVKKYNYRMQDVPFQQDMWGRVYVVTEANTPVYVYVPFILFFIFDIYRTMALHYNTVFFEHQKPYGDVTVSDEIKTNYKRIYVDRQDMVTYPGLGTMYPGTFKTVLTKGLDFIVAKHVDIQTALFYGLRIWHLSGNGVSYGFMHKTDTYTCVAARMNAVAVLSRTEYPSTHTHKG